MRRPLPVDPIDEPCKLALLERPCPDGSTFDPECCLCEVDSCIPKECPGEYQSWNPVTCKCDCKLEQLDRPCPEGSYLDLECCQCVVGCDKPACKQGSILNEDTCQYEPACPVNNTGVECGFDSEWDPYWCRCVCQYELCPPPAYLAPAGPGQGCLCWISCDIDAAYCAAQGKEFSSEHCDCYCP